MRNGVSPRASRLACRNGIAKLHPSAERILAAHVFSKRQIVATLTNQFVRSYRLLYQIRSGRFSQVWAAIDDGTGPRTANSRAFVGFLPEKRNFGITGNFRF